jgi:hypothetical protein
MIQTLVRMLDDINSVGEEEPLTLRPFGWGIAVVGLGRYRAGNGTARLLHKRCAG